VYRGVFREEFSIFLGIVANHDHIGFQKIKRIDPPEYAFECATLNRKFYLNITDFVKETTFLRFKLR